MKTTCNKYARTLFLGVCLGLFLAILLFTPNHANAQSRKLLDRMPSNDWSIDVQIGGGIPLYEGDYGTKSANNAHSLPSIQLGIRHMLSPTWGIRPAYAFHSFNNNGNKDLFNMHQVGVEAIYSLSNMLPERRVRQRQINVLVHFGGYYAWSSAIHKDTQPHETVKDRLATGVLGGTLQWQPRRTSRLAITLDVSGHFSVHQNYGFDAQKITVKDGAWEPLWAPTIFLKPSLGLHYYLGKRRSHVDWR